MKEFFSELIGGLILIVLVGGFVFACSNEKPDDEKRKDYMNHGYTKHQADSMINKSNDDLWTIIILAAS